MRIPEDAAGREAMRREVERRARAELAIEHELDRRAHLLSATSLLAASAGPGRRLAAAMAGSRVWGALASAVNGRGGSRKAGDGSVSYGGDATALLFEATRLRCANHRLVRRQRTLEQGAVHLPRSAATVVRRLSHRIGRDPARPGRARVAARSSLRIPVATGPASASTRAGGVSVVVVGAPVALLRATRRLWPTRALARELLPVATGGGRSFGPEVARALARAQGDVVVVADARSAAPATLRRLVERLASDPGVAAVACAATRFDWVDAAPEPVTVADDAGAGAGVLLGGSCAAFRRELLAEHPPSPRYRGASWLTDLSLEADAHGHRLAVVADPAGTPPIPTSATDVALLRARWGAALRSRILADLLAGGGGLCGRAARVYVEPECPPAVAAAIDDLRLERVGERASADIALGVADGRLTVDWLLTGEGVPASSAIDAERAAAIAGDELSDALAASVAQSAFCIQIGSRDWKAANRGGDAPLARSLARALGRRGHQALLQVAAEADSPAGQCLDVLLTLRGRAAVEPTPGRLNLLWLISHPAEVTTEELDAYDLVLVASRPFAERLAPQIRPPVQPLLQFTDPEVFYPDPDPALHHDVAFVGNWRSVLRPIVWDALATGRPLALYGRGWDRIAPEHTVAEHVPHAELRRVYSSTDVLLCDHWDDMREHGFVSNRIFDALACGTFVIADDNPAIAAELPGAVDTYTDVNDLGQKLDRHLADPGLRDDVAARGRAEVLERHTVDRRVDELLAATACASPTGPARSTSA